jgi:ubiquinol-cytochrome c reductase cytochrome b subunit
MGVAVLIFFALPWLDRSPVKSIRYRGPKFKIALGLFVIAFIGLGILGILPSTPLYTLIAQILSVVYFAFFILMPWYTKNDTYKTEPERVTDK